MNPSDWPLFGLTLRTDRLELRIPSDDELSDLLATMRSGIVDDEPHPFSVPWLLVDEPRRSWNALSFHWRCRAEITPDEFNLVFGVFHDGEVIGSQDIGARDFGRLGGVATGSWISRAWQGRGFAREMRAAVLELGFTHLGATHATSSARRTNRRSMAVSRRLGYQENGRLPSRFGNEVDEDVRFRLDRADWDSLPDRPPVMVDGWGPCAPMFDRT